MHVQPGAREGLGRCRRHSSGFLGGQRLLGARSRGACSRRRLPAAAPAAVMRERVGPYRLPPQQPSAKLSARSALGLLVGRRPRHLHRAPLKELGAKRAKKQAARRVGPRLRLTGSTWLPGAPGRAAPPLREPSALVVAPPAAAREGLAVVVREASSATASGAAEGGASGLRAGPGAEAGARAGRAALEHLNKAFPFLPFLAALHNRAVDGLHKPVGLVATSAWTLACACQVTGMPTSDLWLPVATGAALGGLFAALNRYGLVRAWRGPREPLNVVVTGGTKGLGKALAREFLRHGDTVVISSRTIATARKVAAELQEEAGPGARVRGMACDVASPASVERLAAGAAAALGSLDVWINNAGCSGSFQSFLDARPEQLQRVVRTNLLGALLCARAAMRVMARQPRGGHVFSMDGAGANGMPTPQYAAYGATKAGVAHLMGSLNAEAEGLGLPVRVHTLSPGMVLTELLLDGATLANKQIFNILCEQPETVAAFLVPRARTVAARREAGRYIRFLTAPRALARFLAAPLAAGRFFDRAGEATYEGERERISGPRARRTARLARRVAARTRGLGVAYSASIAAAYLLLAAAPAGLQLPPALALPFGGP